jgi:hypothetical protein
MAGYVVVQITDRSGGGDHTADERVEAVVEVPQSVLDALGLGPGMIKAL